MKRYIKCFESHKNTPTKEELKDMGENVYINIKNDKRVDKSFIWGSFFEKENPNDINIVININVPIGQFDDIVKILTNIQEDFLNENGNVNYLDITIVDSNKEAFELYPTSIKDIDYIKDSNRKDSYENLDIENRIVKDLKDVYSL